VPKLRNNYESNRYSAILQITVSHCRAMSQQTRVVKPESLD